jgi:hypothetical protein
LKDKQGHDSILPENLIETLDSPPDKPSTPNPFPRIRGKGNRRKETYYCILAPLSRVRERGWGRGRYRRKIITLFAIHIPKQVIQRAESEDLSILARKDIIELVITIAVYKSANLSRAEVEAMLDVTLQETRVYREVRRIPESKLPV